MSVTRKPPVTAYARSPVTAVQTAAAQKNPPAPDTGYMVSDNAGSCVETYQISLCPPRFTRHSPACRPRHTSAKIVWLHNSEGIFSCFYSHRSSTNTGSLGLSKDSLLSSSQSFCFAIDYMSRPRRLSSESFHLHPKNATGRHSREIPAKTLGISLLSSAAWGKLFYRNSTFHHKGVFP